MLIKERWLHLQHISWLNGAPLSLCLAGGPMTGLTNHIKHSRISMPRVGQWTEQDVVCCCNVIAFDTYNTPFVSSTSNRHAMPLSPSRLAPLSKRETRRKP